MRTLTAPCLAVLAAACFLSRAVLCLDVVDSQCVAECALFGDSRWCACSDVMERVAVEALDKRGGRMPFRFGKRGGLGVDKRQPRQPFRYGKRAPAAPLLAALYAPSAYDFLEEEK